MRAIAISYTGGYTTSIDFRKETTGKLLQEQKYLMNVATIKGSDPIFPARGTNLLTSAIGGALVSVNGLTDAFAAVDTLYFCNYEESKEMYNSKDNISTFTLIPSAYTASANTVSFIASVTFKDQTSNSTTINIATNG